MSWWIWNTKTFEWVRRPEMKVKIGFEKAGAVPVVENKILPQCPLPQCELSRIDCCAQSLLLKSTGPHTTEAICPPTGTCQECLCQSKDSVMQELKLRQQTDQTVGPI